jgi:8-oxo-dGTP pyrophosphatase MutT (NUDIX family)
MKPFFIGKIVYFFGYPVFRLLIKNTTRAYVIVRFGDELLLTKNWLGFQKKWRLPGGGVQAGELPLAAAKRELYEEVGIQADERDLHLLQKKPFRSKFNYDYYLFTVTVLSRPKLSIDKKEILAAKFVNKDSVAQKHISEEVHNFLRLAK